MGADAFIWSNEIIYKRVSLNNITTVCVDYLFVSNHAQIDVNGLILRRLPRLRQSFPFPECRRGLLPSCPFRRRLVPVLLPTVASPEVLQVRAGSARPGFQ